MLEPAGTAEIRGSKVDATNMGEKRRMPSHDRRLLGGRVGVLKSDLRFTGICELRRKEKKGGDEAFGGDNGRYPK